MRTLIDTNFSSGPYPVAPLSTSAVAGNSKTVVSKGVGAVDSASVGVAAFPTSATT